MLPKKIKKFLESKKVKYHLLEHKTVYTAFDKAATLKVPLKRIGKTVIVSFDRKLAMVLIPGDKKLNLKKVKKGFRGDGKAKLRKRLHNWNFKSLLSKIERTAKSNGIEVIKVNPAFTSVIGSLKYSPQLGIDKDIAGAYVIGRRALGFKEEVPENYLKLLSDREYLEYAIYTYEEKEKELKEQLKKETNQYKRNAINSELKQVQKAKNLLLEKLKSLQGEPSSCEGAKGRNSEQGLVKASQSAWQVLRVAFVLPLLGKFFVRDFSPLKSVMIEGKWQRRTSRLVPLEVGGTSR